MMEKSFNLKDLTDKYGGCRKVNKTSIQRQANGGIGHHQGGDKFNLHDYESIYTKFLPSSEESIKLLEIGVLEGISIAVWSDFYPNGDIDGIDIELDHYDRYREKLKEMGAFANNNVGVKICNSLNQSEVDEYTTNKLQYDVIIDDGDHRSNSIIKTFHNFYKYLQTGGVYFIEDNDQISRRMLNLSACDEFHKFGQLSVVIKRKSKVFITSLFSTNDKPIDLPGKFNKMDDWDYILFTNLNIKNTSWDVRQINLDRYKSAITQSRYPKFQGHYLIKHDMIVYCDAYLSPICNKEKWEKICQTAEHSENGIVQNLHPELQCAYDECKAILSYKKDNKTKIDKTLDLLMQKQIPKKYGLWRNTYFCYLSRNQNALTLLDKTWDYLQNNDYTHRDQPLYALASFETNIKPAICNLDCMFVCTGKMGLHKYN